MNDNFIEHKDPTQLIDLSQVTLEQQYAKLTEEEKIMIAAKCLGMDHVPVPIRTFVCDDYFLGGEQLFNKGKAVFNYWFDKLDMLFPDPITNRFPYISLEKSVGQGKSTVSKIIGLYNLHKLDCCKNLYSSIGLAGGVKVAMAFFHPNISTAEKDFRDYFRFAFDISPYFRNQYHGITNNVRMIASGMLSTGSILGSQIIFAVLSEIGHVKPSVGMERVSEVITRYESRFANKRKYFGGVIADSSARDEDESAVNHFKESVSDDDLVCLGSAQWVTRPELYAESEGKTFRFFIGDAIQGPRVVEDDEDIVQSGLNADRIIEVPISAKYKFLTDPIRNMRDLAGISFTATEKFFPSIQHLINCSRLKNYAPEKLVVDFYDKSDSIFSHVSSMIYRIPRGTNLFIHYDIGLKNDNTGVSICMFNGTEDRDGILLPKFKFPLLFVVSRKKGQSTSLDHLYQFIKDVINAGYYVDFSADSFASAGIFQNCERDRVPYKSISADKTMDAYNMFKNIVDTERAEMVYNNILLRECSEIRLVFNGKSGEHAKIDHPAVSKCTCFDYSGKTSDMPGTKDLVDAAVCSLYSCYQKYAEYLETGTAGGVSKTVSAINSLTADPREEAQKRFQGMLESLF